MFKFHHEQLYIIIIIFLIFFEYSDNDCLTHSFPDLNLPTALTLENGFHLVVTSTGIYSFFPKLTKIKSNYNYTTDQKMETDPYHMEGTINQNEISQFISDDGYKKHVICLAKYYLYFMNEKGEVLFNKKLSELSTQNSLSLIAYHYSEGNYYFVVGYNKMVHPKNSIMFYYYKIETKGNNIKNLSLEYSQEFLPNFEKSHKFYLQGISCQIMLSSEKGKVLTCFEFMEFQYGDMNNGNNDIKRGIVAFSFRPENNFELLFYSNLYEEVNTTEVNSIKSAINNDRTKALVCYSIEYQKIVKCIYYDINQNTLFQTELFLDFCLTDYFGFNIYYFQSTDEYILCCLSIELSKLHIFKVTKDFIINRNETDLFQYTFEGCATYNFYSIIFLSKYNQYYALINSNCNNQNHIRIYMISKSECKLPTSEEDEVEDEGCTEYLPTTYIQTTTPLSIETTIPQYIETTIPQYIETTIPQIIETTIPQIIETTIPQIIETTIPKIIETTIPQEIETTIPKNIETTILKTCEDKTKIYKEGKCICNNEEGYYPINYSPPDNKCYKKEDLPTNFYLNTTSKSFELCYKTCGSCIEGGTGLENNCLSCGIGFSREPEKNSSNCVKKCNYFYYYDSSNQYICTEDEQCPDDASLIIRKKKKCIDKCSNDYNYSYQYNGECLQSCPNLTLSDENKICKINNTAICTSSDYKLNLDETISEENVKLTAKNYASEFYYTKNHISKFISSNFTMILYKNNSCINELQMKITQINSEDCINQLKIDNNIDKNKDLIVAVIDIKSGDNQVASFGFFNPDNGEKLDASKSCAGKTVMMYEDIFSILKNPLAEELIKNQKINLLDLNSEFYNDICFHFNSPNGKDATLQDRIKAFYPNMTLCDPGCRNRGVNASSLKAECECTFQDLLSKNIFSNDLFGNNVLIKESLQGIVDMINNLNIEVLMCYKDFFDFEYFKKNKSGFIVLSLIILHTIFIIYYFLKSKIKLIRYISALSEKYIFYISKKNKNSNNKIAGKITNAPPQKNKNKERYKGKKKSKNKEIIKDENKDRISEKSKEKLRRKSKDKEKGKNKDKRKINFKQINILNFNFQQVKNNDLKSKENFFRNNRNSLKTNVSSKTKLFKIKTQNKNLIRGDYTLLKYDLDIEKYLEPDPENMEYDDVVDEDKRTFCQYFCEKITENQIIINTFFVQENIKPKSIKIAILIIIINIFFLTNGLFYSDSYISSIFNSTEKETAFSFVWRSIDRFIYASIIGNIIAYIINIFFVEEKKIKKLLLKNKNDILNIRYEISNALRTIDKNIKILIIINYVIFLFSLYYLSCFNNVYPNLNREWIFSSLFIIGIIQILPFATTFLETCIRFISIKCESEKLFKVSLLLS